jgi:Flp pilus assembly protein TadD
VIQDKEAITFFDRASRFEPQKEKIFRNKGLVLEKIGDTENANGCYDE